MTGFSMLVSELSGLEQEAAGGQALGRGMGGKAGQSSAKLGSLTPPGG